MCVEAEAQYSRCRFFLDKLTADKKQAQIGNHSKMARWIKKGKVKKINTEKRQRHH